MERRSDQPRWISRSILISSGYFMLALLISAVFVPSLRLLHALQALIYVAVIVLTRRHSAWGFGAGCFIAAFWNYIFIRGAAADILAFIRGRVIRPDVAIQLGATVAHFLLIVACITGFLLLKPCSKQWAKFVAAGITSVGYLVLLMITLRPQYIPLLKKCFGM